MKKSLLQLFSITAASLVLSACDNILPSASPIEPTGGKDRLVCGDLAKDVCNANQKISDGNVLKLSSPSGNKWWARMFVSRDGIFKPDTDYLVKFNYKTEVPNSKLLFIIREANDTKGRLDVLHVSVEESPDFKTFEIKFHTPKSDLSKHSMQFHSFGEFKGEVKNLQVFEVSDAFYPISADSGVYRGDLGKLPTGAKEFDVELPNNPKGAVVNAKDFGIVAGCAEFVAKLNAALEHCKKTGAAKLVLDKGDYYSNENKTIVLKDMKDFVLDGSGSTFTFLRTKYNSLTVEGCERVKLCNFNFDWDWSKDPLGSIVEIAAIKRDGENSYVDFEFVDYKNQTYPQRDVRVGHISPIDPKTRSIGVEDGKAASWEMRGKRNDLYKKEWLSGNVLRIYVKESNVIFEKGELYRMNHYYYDMNCTHMTSNKNLTLENINMYSTPGHAFVVGGSQQYWQFVNVNIAMPKNDPKRAVTCTADHLHITRSKGFFKMINCDFGFGGDDCLNAHDCTLFVRPSGKRTMRTVNPRGIHNIAKGAKVELRQGDYSPSGMVAVVEDIKRIDKEKGIYEVAFDRDLPEEKFDGFILFNLDFQTRNLILRNCYFHENKARGVLILCKDVTIENCRFFHNESAALKFETGYTFNLWSEGYGVDNVVVRNCKFDTVNSRNGMNDGKLRDIFMGVYMKTDPSSIRTTYPIISNILFENNEFKNSAGLIAFITSTGNVTFKDNMIINDVPRKTDVLYRGGFWVSHSQNTRIINNTWVKSPYVPNAGVYADLKTVENLVVAGNKIVEKK